MTDSSGSTSWTYDTRGRVTQETKVIDGTGGGTFVTQYGYDALDRPVWMKYPGGNAGQIGEQVNFTYNAASQLNKVYGTNTYVNSSTYDAAGRLDVRQLGWVNNNFVVRTDYVYFPWTTVSGAGRLQQIVSGIPNDLDLLQNLQYTYDAVGNVMTIADWNAGGTQTFHYDALDRLIDAQASGGTGGTYPTETYTYNAIGNITSKAGASYTYNATVSGCAAGTPSPKPHAVSQVGSYAFAYDCNGNLTTRNESTGTYNQTWDKENRLTGITGAATATFVYDGDGNRVKATVNGVTTVYVGNYYELSGSTTKKYYSAGSQRVALRENSTLYFLLGDHLGSTAITANSSGGLYAEQRYKPWGETRYTSGTPTPTTYRFTGQREEVGLGSLYFYNARFYSPAVGRFLSADTIVPEPGNPQAFNRYAYVVNNPLKYTDPTGHCFIICIGVGTVLGGIIGAGVGFVSYVASTIINGTEYNADTATAAVVAGATGGASIGFGVTALASGAPPVVASVAINAGANTIAATTATISAGNFDAKDIEINAKTAFASGAIQGLIPGAGPVTTGLRAGVAGFSTGVGSIWSDVEHGRQVDTNKAAYLGGIGTLISGISDKFTTSLQGGSLQGGSGTQPLKVPPSLPGNRFYKSITNLNAGGVIGLTTVDVAINRHPAYFIQTWAGQEPIPQ